jgi:hypothetical protein
MKGPYQGQDRLDSTFEPIAHDVNPLMRFKEARENVSIVSGVLGVPRRSNYFARSASKWL